MDGTLDSVEDAMAAFNGDIDAFEAAVSAKELDFQKLTERLTRAIVETEAERFDFDASLSAEYRASLDKFCTQQKPAVACYKVLTTPVTYVPQTKGDLRWFPDDNVDKNLVDCREVNGEYVPVNAESRTSAQGGP